MLLPILISTAVWDGTEMIIFRGSNPGGYSNKGVKYSPAANTWLAITDAREKVAGHCAVWNGTEMIVWGGRLCQHKWIYTVWL